MKLHETISQDKEKLSRLDKKGKALFLWDYYKIPILAAAVVLFIATIAFFDSLGRKDVLFYAVLLNSDDQAVEADQSVFDSLMESSGYDMDRKTVDIRTDLRLGDEYNSQQDGQTLQVLTALFAISDMDIYVSPKEYFDLFARDEGFADLSQILEQDLLNRYRDSLYYYEEKPCGIILKNGSVLHQAGYYHDEVIIGIVTNAVNRQAAIDFLSGLLEKGS